jgi:hypothetical protein
MVDSAVPWWTTAIVLVTFDTDLSNSYMQSAGNSSCTVFVQLRRRLGMINESAASDKGIGVKKCKQERSAVGLSDLQL